MSEDIRILCVDDEENILKAIQRSLRKVFDIHTAASGRQGLEMMRNEGPFQIIVSDMRMPEMDGAVFLKAVREEFPDTVRLLLTGFADMETVVSAINEGNIFRFIAKPCPASVLRDAFNDAIRQYQLLTAEKVLLEQTLKGSIHALTEVLSLSNPAAFGRGTRIRHFATMMATELSVPDLWQIEVAAMLSQIGSITLPEETIMKVYRGDELSVAEQTMVARLPEMTRNVLGGIPRLDGILEILDYQTKNFDGTGFPQDSVAGEEIPLGARILKVAVRWEELQSKGESPGRIIDNMNAGKGLYDPDVLNVFAIVAEKGDGKETARGVSLRDLRTGMVFTEDVKSKTGVLLVAGGQEVSISLLERIQNYEATVGLKVPMWVLNPLEEDEVPPVQESTENVIGNTDLESVPNNQE
ncbi:MAG: response regulator [Gemmatimonadales bacterium]|nr:response regulator [Gemmatimonadales bacterium]